MYFALYAVVLVLLCLLALRYLIYWLIRKIGNRLSMKISYGRLGLLKLHDLSISKLDKWEIDISSVCLTSSLISNRSRKLIGIVLGSVHAKVVLKESNRKRPAKEGLPIPVDVPLPSFVTGILQYVCIAVDELSLLIEQNGVNIHYQSSCCMCLSKNEQTSNIQSCAIVAEITGATVKLEQNGAVLVKASTFVDVKANLLPSAPISSLDIKLDVREVDININEDLLRSLKAAKLNADSTPSTGLPHLAISDEDEPLNPSLDVAVLTKSMRLLPKTVSFEFKRCKLQYESRDTQYLILEWTNVLSWMRKTDDSTGNSSYELRLECLDVTLSDDRVKAIWNLKQINISSQFITSLDKQSIFVSCSINGLHVNCLPERTSYWLHHFGKYRQRAVSKPLVPKGSGSKHLFVLNKIPANTKLLVSLSARHCCLDIVTCREDTKLRSFSTFYVGELESTVQTQSLGEGGLSPLSVTASSRDFYVYVNKKYLSNGTPLLEFPSLGMKDSLSTLPSMEKHVWGRVVELGKMSLKILVDVSVLPFRVKTSGEIYFLTVECSAVSLSHIVDFAKDQMRVMSNSKMLDAMPVADEPKTEIKDVSAALNFTLDAEFHTSDVHVFLVGDREGGANSLHATLETLDIATGSVHGPWMLEFKGIKMFQFDSPIEVAPYPCSHATNLASCLGDVSTVSVFLLMNDSTKNLTVSVPEVLVKWNPTRHMILFELMQQAASLRDHVTEVLNDMPSQDSVGDRIPSNVDWTFRLDVMALDFSLATGYQHSCSLSLSNFSLSYQMSLVELKTSDGQVLFDGHAIFMAEEFEVKRVRKDIVEETRSKVPWLGPNETAWGLSLYSLKVYFPHKYNFAQSMDQLQNFIKMLKLLHASERDSAAERIPPDILLHCQNVRVEIEDNPFETRLAENYMLRIDEAAECIEREAKLMEKLNSLQSAQGTLFSSKKMDGIFSSLKEKNSQIYISRSKAYQEKKTDRPPLFRYCLLNVNCLILADAALTGRENGARVMQELDPDTDLQDDVVFSTLICRYVEGSFNHMTMSMRDYPQALMSQENYKIAGRLLFAEPKGDKLAVREAVIRLPLPWRDLTVVRNMPAMKIYYDLEIESDSLQTVWGVNLESAWAAVSQSFDLLTKPTLDPSPPLPFWDKCRIIFHGKLRSNLKELTMILNASRDPYDVTEKLEMVWTNTELTWTNAKILMIGDLDLYTRTASKYDDHRVVHIPSFKLCVDLTWACSGDANAHYDMQPRNPALLTEREATQDTYKLFRSHNLNMVIEMDACHGRTEEQLLADPPALQLYATSLRWFQKYQAIVLRNVSRPITSGKLFSSIVKPKKKAFSRHIKFLSMNFRFPCLNATYYGSFTREAGLAMKFGRGSVGIKYQVHIDQSASGDNLRRRPVAEWIIRGLKFQAEKTTTSLIGTREFTRSEADPSTSIDSDTLLVDIDKTVREEFLFSVERVEYKRQTPTVDMSKFTHRVALHEFHGAVTSANRDTALQLFKAYTKMQTLKRVLSSDVFKLQSKEKDICDAPLDSLRKEASPSPLKKMQSGHGVRLLQQLVSEKTSKFMANVEEAEGGETDLNDSASTIEDDVIRHDWQIELINSQVLLKANEGSGAVLVTAANATILKRLHLPVKGASEVVNKLNKVTWSASLDNLQYFSALEEMVDLTAATIPWADLSVVSAPASGSCDDDAHEALHGDGESVGSTVAVELGAVTYHLQRVISKCRCEVNYISLDPEIDPYAEEVSPTVAEETAGGVVGSRSVDNVNTLTIRHPLLDISTSPEQFATVMDICQNLILYTEPKRKEAQNRLVRMKFKLELSTSQDLKGDIQQLKEDVRDAMLKLRQLERNLYECRRTADALAKAEQDFDTQDVKESIENLQELIETTKDRLYSDADDLKLMIRAYKDVVQLTTLTPSNRSEGSDHGHIAKKIKVYFDEMKWRLTQDDGRLGIAGAVFKKFMYNKVTYTDNTCEHRLELGDFALCNLLPNDPYRNAFSPHEVNLRRRVDKSVYMRIFCRIKPPVGGINVREHFEVNVCPVAVRLTFRFYQHLEAFFFPHRSTVETSQGVGDPGTSLAKDEQKTIEMDGMVQPKKAPPPRPPPPKWKPPSSPSVRRSASSVSRAAADSQIERRKSNLAMPSASAGKDISASPPHTPSLNTPTKGSGVRRSQSLPKKDSTDDRIDKMRERASKNQTFIYIKIPEVPLCFSYKGEKERNIEDANEFSLCLPTLEYHNRTWTWQDLLLAMKKDYTQVLVPQIIKEKLHLKGGWENKPGMAEADDDDKAKLLFGEKQHGSQKKQGKKVLFGKLTSLLPGTKSAHGKSRDTQTDVTEAEQSGRGVDPQSLQDTFNKLRTFSKDGS